MGQLRVVFAAALLVTVGCSEPTVPASPLRLGELLPTPSQLSLPLAAGIELEQEIPQEIDVEIEAPQATTLEFLARGAATQIEVNWRLAGEQRYFPGRARGIALEPGEEEHPYTLELQGHRAWGGRVEALRLRALGGGLEIIDLNILTPPSPYRNVEIGRRLIPSLTGQQRLEIELPPGLPKRAHFDARLGLMGSARGQDVTVRFAAWVEVDGERTPWFDEERSSPEQFEAWHPVRREVNIPAGGTLVLSSEVTDGGKPRSSTPAVWGQPLLLFEPNESGIARQKIGKKGVLEQGTPRNLLVIAVDTLRADMLGSYGNEDGLTPHLDALAKRGFRLADLSSPAPWTLPSFASLMTGLQPQTHEAGRRLDLWRKLHNDQISRLEPSHPTLAETLTRAGFRTAGFYTNVFLNPSFGLHRGFDEYQGFEPLTRAETVIDRALEWLEPVADERFFLFVHLFDPHSPYRPPPSFCKQVPEHLASADETETPCLAVRSVKEAKIPRNKREWAAALYRAEVAYTDHQIGRLLQALEARPDGGRTMVLLMSDHGEELWEHEDQRIALDYHPLAGHGHSHYQELLHVPVILTVPGAEPAEVEQGTEMVDLFPTLLGFLGVEAPPNQGRDLRPQLDGARVSEPLRLSDFQLYGSPRWSARRGPWKLVVRPGEEEILELYHLEEDPEERKNLAAERPDIVTELRQSAEAEFLGRASHRLGREAGEIGQAAQLGEEELERLRALGYIQ